MTLTQKERTLVNLKFKTTLPIEELEKISTERKRILKKTKGLISFFCYTNDETKTIGGIFIFESLILANQYVGKFLTDGLGPKYGVIPMTLKIDIGSIKEEIIGENFDIENIRE
ncbi:hypothetical protein [uncultured Aquimarina sp.]|uniref:hypothetical protein n=1 Tax=uncultured Aquimarina sp. TaxID=575652 RepID=UPI00262118C2|nr:hypothetical protein [uncultured Aquimarina sp.]